MPDPTPGEATTGDGTPAATPVEVSQPPAGGTPAAQRSLEELLSGLSDGDRSIILGEVHKARSEAQGLRSRLRDAEPKVQAYDALEEASRSDLEKAQAAAIEATRRADELQARAVQAEIKAAAAGKFADPSDAVAFLTGDYTTEDGGIDTDRIAAEMTDLLTRKPHLGTARGPIVNPAQGTSAQGPASPGQLSQTDIERLYKERRYDEIEKARTEGRLTSLLGGSR